MTVSDAQHQDDLSGCAAEVLQAVIHDPALTRWLFGLERLSDNERVVQIAIVVKRMRKGNETPAIINAIRALENRRVYQGVLKAVRDLI